MNLATSTRREILQPILVAVKQQSQVSPWRTRFAWLLLGLAVLFAALDLLMWPFYLPWTVRTYDLPISVTVMAFIDGLATFSMVLLVLLGTLIALAQPDNRIGWLLCGAVVAMALIMPIGRYSVYAYVIYPQRELPLLHLNPALQLYRFGYVFHPENVPLRELALWIQHWTWILPLSALYVGLPLLFPDGHLPSKRWRWFALFSTGVIGLMTFIAAFHPDVEMENEFLAIKNDLTNPHAIDTLPKSLLVFYLPSWMVFIVILLPVSCISLVARYRNADPTIRHQIKWFALWLGLVIMIFVMGNLDPVLHYSHDLRLVITLAQQVTISSLPIFLGISIFAYRLYDIDIIINRTLVYALLTAGIVGMYVVIVGLLGSVFRTSNDLIASLIVTGLVAVSFHSLRERVQRGVNRLMFGQRDEPYRILSRLGQQLNTAATTDNLLPSIAETIATALKLPYVAITMRQDDDYVMGASYGTSTTSIHTVPLIYQNEQVGQLVVGQRAPGEALTPADQRVLDDIARQMGAVVHAVRLTRDLQRSRERLVTAREEERRRLRRDLHDGLGPALASQTLKLDAAIDLVETSPQVATRLLAEVKSQSQALVTDVRRLVYDLRPPALDELGLLAALRSNIAQLNTSGSGTEIIIEGPGQLPHLSAAVELAVYRIAQEAALNVIKHAQARHCTVRLSVDNTRSRLQLDVTDDGIGLPQPVTSGVGLQSMRERTEELGGDYTASTLPSGGARILVRLPLTPMETSS